MDISFFVLDCLLESLNYKSPTKPIILEQKLIHLKLLKELRDWFLFVTKSVLMPITIKIIAIRRLLKQHLDWRDCD